MAGAEHPETLTWAKFAKRTRCGLGVAAGRRGYGPNCDLSASCVVRIPNVVMMYADELFGTHDVKAADLRGRNAPGNLGST